MLQGEIDDGLWVEKDQHDLLQQQLDTMEQEQYFALPRRPSPVSNSCRLSMIVAFGSIQLFAIPFSSDSIL
jgi:hypothetical protein